METNTFQQDPGPGKEFPKLAPLVKILGLSWDLPGQSHLRWWGQWKPTFSRRVLGSGQEFPKLAPLVKILGMSWDLPGQSHLR